MRTFKLLAILLILLSFTACKKEKTENFDISKYSIVGKFSTGFPYIMTFGANGQAELTANSVSNGSYTYVNGVLNFSFADGEVPGAFKIENGGIKSFDGPLLINTYDLVKIPATDQLDGKTFKGAWTNSGQLTQLKFSGTRCIEVNGLQQSGLEYVTVNNLAKRRVEPGSLTVFILMNQKLEGGRDKSPNKYWGTFTEQ